jgi:hypothetical protein
MGRTVYNISFFTFNLALAFRFSKVSLDGFADIILNAIPNYLYRYNFR